MFKKSLVALAITIAASATLYAITMTHPAGFKVTYPDEWTQKIDGDDLKILSPDGKAVILFRVLEVNSVPDAVKNLDTEVRKIIANPKFEHKPQATTINNLTGLLSDGSGTIKNIKVKWLVGLFLRENKGLMVLGSASADAFDKNKATLQQIINSISGQ
jgi:hypothetical protein